MKVKGHANKEKANWRPGYEGFQIKKERDFDLALLCIVYRCSSGLNRYTVFAQRIVERSLFIRALFTRPNN